MNWKMIIRAAFDLSDEEWDQAVKLRALSEPERELLTTALGPHKPATRKSSKKAGKKSARASGMAAQLNKQLGNRRQEQEPEDGEGFDVSRLCFKCAKLADNNVHHLENDPDYHLFIESLSEEARAASGE